MANKNFIVKNGITLQGNGRGIYVTPSGDALFCADDSQNRVYKYSFGTAFDVTTLSYVTNYNIGNSSVRAPMFTNNGANFYNSVTTGSPDYIWYDLNIPTAYTPPSSGYSQQNFGGDNNNNYAGIIFQPDGLNCYVVDETATNTRVLRRFVLSTPWDISSYTNPSDSLLALDAPLSFDISSDGKYIFYQRENTIYRLALGPL